MKRWLKWLGGALVTVGLAALLIWAIVAGRAEQAMEREREWPVIAPQHVSDAPGGERVVAVDPKTQSRMMSSPYQVGRP